jgi:hypothetical protein
MQKSLLINRTYNTVDLPGSKNNWYSHRDVFDQFKSIVECQLTIASSSAGDWEGYITQRIGKRNYVIPFFQENNYPRAGFTIRTAQFPAFSYEGDLMPIEEVCKILYEGADNDRIVQPF